MPLFVAPIGKELLIKRVSGETAVKRHLESLGIVKDQKITILSYTANGLIVRVGDSRLALDRNIALGIMVD